MKKIGRLFVFIFVIQIVTISTQLLFAQKLKPTDVPAEVSQTLEFQYPSVKVLSWIKEEGHYLANIKDEGSTGKVYISSEGEWLRTTFAVPATELPATIVEYVKANYPDFIISEACLEEKENEKTHYYVEVKLDGLGHVPSILLFSTTGTNELISRKDPENFQDPLVEKEKPQPVVKPPKEKPVEVIKDEYGNIALDVADVPEVVTKAFAKKVPNPSELYWFHIDGKYVAKCVVSDKNTDLYYTPEGVWEKTVTEIEEGNLTSTIRTYLDNNYKGRKVQKISKEQRADKKDVTIVEFYEKSNIKEKLMTTVVFDKANKVINTTRPKVEKPESEKESAAESSKPASNKPAPAKPVADKPAKPVKEETKPEEKPKKEKPAPIVKDENGNIALNPKDVPEVVTKALAKKVMHPEELYWYKIDTMYVAKCMNVGKKTAVYLTPKGIWDKTLTVLPEESVTGPMLKHLNDFYSGFKFKTAVKEQRADKDDKTMVEFYEKNNYKSKIVTTIIFDKTGKLIRTIDPDYEPEVSNQSEEDAALEKYYEKMNMSLSQDESQRVPENVTAAFKLKYPRVTNVEWKEDGNMNYQAIYYSARGKEICVLNSYGEIVETWLLGKPESLSANIQDYLKREHKGCKVVEYYSVKKIAEKLNLYKVMIQNKKTGEEDELWFNLSGKPVEM